MSFNNRLARKHLFYVVACSSFFAVLITCIQLYFDYKKDVAEIDDDFAMIEKSYIPSILSSIYNFDNQQLKLLLMGILKLRDVVYVEIYKESNDHRKILASTGDVNASGSLSRHYPLVYQRKEKTLLLGTLHVQASLAAVYSRLRHRIIVIVVSNAVKTFLMSFCILWIVHVLTVRHLKKISDFTSRLQADSLDQKLVLNKRKSTKRPMDELDEIVAAINNMMGRIKKSFEESNTAKQIQKKLLDELEEKNEALKIEISQREKLQFQLIQAQKLEAIGTLAGGIAHDFNNILFPLIGFAEMLREDLPPKSPLRTNVDEIFKAALRAKELVKQILDYSSSADKNIKPTQLQPIIAEVLNLLRSSIPNTIEIERDIDPDCGVVLAAPTQIHQIVMNLVTNAFHAMENTNGRISVILKQIKLESDQAPLLKLAPGDYALLCVKDSGIGIEASIRSKIFDPYFTTKETGKGSGIGLSVVHGIINSCNGDIRIDSEPGKGTSASVYLPIVGGKIEEMPVPDQSRALRGAHEKILLVDDEKAIVRMQEIMLQRLGYQVTAFTESIKAFNAFKDSPDAFDLIITDMTMPDLTGLQLAEKIRLINIKIPILICTGLVHQIDSDKMRALEPFAVLAKPIVGKEIAKAIIKIMDRSKSN